MKHSSIIIPKYSDLNAIKFLKSEFNEKYNEFYNKFMNKQNKNNKLFSFYHYKTFAIVNLFLIYDYDEYIKYLENNNLPMNNFNL